MSASLGRATTITVTERTRRLLESIKGEGESFDDMIQSLLEETAYGDEFFREIERRLAGREAHSWPQGHGTRGAGLTPYDYELLESAEQEFLALRGGPRELFKEKLLYLLQNPFRSYPWLRVRQGARHPGEWRFRRGAYRVFYRVDGYTVVFTRIASRPGAHPRRPPKSQHSHPRRSR